jgi:hypothetical protein
MRRTLVYALLLTGLCIGLAALTLTTYGCSSLAHALNIVNPSYALVDVAPHVNLSIPPSMDFDLTIGVDNPNSVALNLDRFDFNLFVNDRQVGNGSSFDRIIVPAHSVGNVRLRTHLTYDNLRTIYREVVDAVQGNRARYALRGNAEYDTPIGRLNFPVNVVR